MGSGGISKHLGYITGPLQMALGTGAIALGQPEIGIPLIAGGLGNTAGQAAGHPGIGEAAGLGAGTLGAGAMGMGPLGGALPGMLPSSIAGPMAQNTMLPGPAAVQGALNSNPALKGLTLGSFQPQDVLSAAQGPMAGGAGAGQPGPLMKFLGTPVAGAMAGAMMNPQQQQPQPMMQPPQRPPMQASGPMPSQAPLPPPQMVTPGAPMAGAQQGPPGQPQLTPQILAMLMQQRGMGMG